jgi:hypothetical protein
LSRDTANPISGGNRDAPPKPFGLLGSSFLRKWGTVIIDPFSHAVWLKLGQ